jgi:hypothetical protein
MNTIKRLAVLLGIVVALMLMGSVADALARGGAIGLIATILFAFGVFGLILYIETEKQ